MIAAYGGEEAMPLEAMLAQIWLRGGCSVNPDEFDDWPIDRIFQWRAWGGIFAELANPSGG
jgi:hypothetical protein